MHHKPAAWLCLILGQIGLASHAQCVANDFGQLVRTSSVRIMTHVETDGLMPAELADAYVANASPTPGVSGPAMAIGNLIGNLIVGHVHAGRQAEVARQRQWVTSVLERVRPEELLGNTLKDGLTSEGFSDLHVDKDVDPMDLEQPGLLRRIPDAYILTAAVNYGWLGGDSRTAWAKLRLRLWRKGEFKSVSCRDYFYVGGDSVAKEEGAGDKLQIDQMVEEAIKELSGMVMLDVHLTPAPGGTPSEPSLVAVNLPSLPGEQDAVRKDMASLALRPHRWVTADVPDKAAARWWSLPSSLVMGPATPAASK